MCHVSQALVVDEEVLRDVLRGDPGGDWAKLAKVPPAEQVECQMRGWCTASCGGRT